MLDKLLTVAGSVGSAMGAALGMSEEQRRFYADGYRCQACHTRLLNMLGAMTVEFLAADGRKLAAWAGGAFRADSAKCPQCGHLWKLYGNAASAPPMAETITIVESDRSEEFIGEDRRVIDNSQSASTPTRTFSFSKEWSKTLVLEMEHATTGGATLTLGAKEVAALTASSEQKLRQTYSATESVRETSTEEVSCQAAAHQSLLVIVKWKRIWQHGYLTIEGREPMVRVPFRVVVGATFDQQQIDGTDAAASN